MTVVMDERDSVHVVYFSVKSGARLHTNVHYCTVNSHPVGLGRLISCSVTRLRFDFKFELELSFVCQLILHCTISSIIHSRLCETVASKFLSLP